MIVNSVRVDEWMVSILLVHSIEWRWCVLLPACTVRWCGPCPVYPSAVLMSTAVVSHTVPLPGVWCSAGSVCVCAVRVVGYPLCATPLSWWWVGAIVDGGWHCAVGRHGDGRAGAVMVTLPLNAGVPSRLCGGRVEWREWCVL